VKNQGKDGGTIAKGKIRQKIERGRIVGAAILREPGGKWEGREEKRGKTRTLAGSGAFSA